MQITKMGWVVGALVWMGGAPGFAPAFADDLKIVSIEGQAYDATGAELKVGQVLARKQAVVTDGKSQVKLVFGKTIGTRVGPHSSVEFEGGRRAGTLRATLNRGGLLSVVKNPKKIKNIFSVKTRAATMGVRGTMFYVQDTGSGPVFFCPCMGSVNVEAPDHTSSRTLTSKHHESRVFIAESAVSAGASAGPIADRLKPTEVSEGHSDGELDDLKALLN